MGRRVRFDLSVVVVTETVRDLVGRCSCPVQFPMVKVGEGKYQIGDSRTLIFVRVLRNHVMVRVGGGWDTLENYLNKHDPCCCQYKGHRGGAAGGGWSTVRHQIMRRSSTSSLIASRVPATSPSPSPSPAPAALNNNPPNYPQLRTPPTAAVSPYSQSCIKGSHSEHVSFTKGPSPTRTGLPTSQSYHKGLNPGRSSSPSPGPGSGSGSSSGQTDQYLTPGRSSSFGLVGILKNSPSNPSTLRSTSPEFDGVRRSGIPTSVSSQSFREMRDSRESSVGRSSSSSRSTSPSMLRQGEDRLAKPSHLPQRCKSPSPGLQPAEGGRCMSPAGGVSGGTRSLLPRAVFGAGGSGIPRPMSPGSVGFGVRRPHSSLSKSVSFDTADRTDDEANDTDCTDNMADTETASHMASANHHRRQGHPGQGDDDTEVTPMERINTMTLTEFRKLVNNNLSVDGTSDVRETPTPTSTPTTPKSSNDEAAERGLLKRSQSADPQTSSWHQVRDKARSMCSSFASRLTGKKQPASGRGAEGGTPTILARKTPPKSPSMVVRKNSSSSSTTAERPKTPSTFSSGERPKTPVLAPRSKTPTFGYASRPKIPVASVKPEVRESPRPQTPSRPKTPTAVASSVGASSSVRNPLVRAASAGSEYSVTVNAKTSVTSVKCTNALRSPESRAKNSSFVYASVENSDFGGRTRVTGIAVQSQYYESSSDDERLSHSGSSGTTEEGDEKRSVSVSVRSTTPISSRIPKPSFIPRAATPVSAGGSQDHGVSTGRSNGGVIARGGRSRPSAPTGRSSLERQTSGESGDGQKQATTPRTTRRRLQAPKVSGGCAAEGGGTRRAQTPGLENNPHPAASVMRTPRAITPGPEVSTPKADPNSVILRGDSRRKKDRSLRRRSRSLTDLLQAVETISKEIHRGMPNLSEKDATAPCMEPKNSRPKLQKQKTCDAEVYLISRDSQGQHSVRRQLGGFATPQPRRKLQLQQSASLDVDRARSVSPGPQFQPRSILRKPREQDVCIRVSSRTEAWVDSTLHDPKRKQSTSHLRRPMTPNSLSIAESELLSRPLEEIQAALPSPSKVLPAVDHESMDVPAEDPEMYRKMEMLFEKYREMELRASVRDTPGGSQDNINALVSKSSGSHVSSGGQGQDMPSSSPSSNSLSPIKAGTTALAGNAVSLSSGISSVRSGDTDSSRALSLEERTSRDSSPSRAASSLQTNEGASNNSEDFPDHNVHRDQACACVTPRPQPPPTPVDRVMEVDADTFAKNPSALVSKIKEILQIRPRKDSKEKSGLPTRIPAPAPTTPRKLGSHTPRAGSVDSPAAVCQPSPNGYDGSREETSNSDASSECGRAETPVSRAETPASRKAGKGTRSLMTQTPVRLFGDIRGWRNGSNQLAPATCSASPFDEDDDDQYF